MLRLEITSLSSRLVCPQCGNKSSNAYTVVCEGENWKRMWEKAYCTDCAARAIVNAVTPVLIKEYEEASGG